MKTEILISCDEWENRVAVLEEDSLAEIYFEREEKVIGSIYKGRVENVLPGMGACFVNIGLGRNAFLYVDDIMRDPINIGETEITDRRKGHTVNELLKVGSDVLVQIVKEPRGLKGARVSTNISLPGRYLVLMPTGRYSGVSSKIEDANERARLKQVLRRVRPDGMATIVRTAAQGVSEAELIADLGVQLRLWHGILESYKRSSAPALLHKDLNLAFKAVRDFLTSDVSAVYIDSKEQYEEIRSTMSLLAPQYIDRLKFSDGPGTLFAARGIDEELQKLLKPKIPLPSGGHLVLEHTEALTVIDVNTGKFTGGRNLEDTIVKTNLEAAAEIARQVRLRDIGGIIVVDFIDMARERSREQVIGTLTASLRRDRTRSTIQAFSNLGLLEFTRKRVGKDLAGQLRSECPYCSGLGTVMSSETLAIGVLRQIRGMASNGHRVRKLDVLCDASVATQLVGWYHEELEKLAHDHDIEVGLFAEPLRHREHILVEESRRLRPAPQPGALLEAELLPVRMPNPASGVAVVNGYVIEVKDAANGVGQTVKIKIDAVDNNLVHAELAEALQLGQRRRRRERGRGKGLESEAPIAPPVPTLERRAERSEERQRIQPAARSVPERARQPVVSNDEEPEEAVREPVASRRQYGASASGRRRPHEAPDESEARPARRRARGSRSGTPQYPAPLVVGGEGDIDYEDDDDDAAVGAATRSPAKAADEESAGVASGRRRRRRRGRGKEREPEGATSQDSAADEDEDFGQDDDAVVIPSRAPASAPARRPAAASISPRRSAPSISTRRPAAPSISTRGPAASSVSTRGPAASSVSARRPAASGGYVRDRSLPQDDDLETVVDPRRSAPSHAQKRYGEVRQIYGRPLPSESGRPAPSTKRPLESDIGARAYRPKAEPPMAARRPRAADDLDVVIKPRRPAAIHVDVRLDVPRRSSQAGRPPAEVPSRRDYSDERARRARPERAERQRRPFEEQDERAPEKARVERGPRRSSAPRSGARTKPSGPAVKQLYPPPDHEEDFEAAPAGTAPTINVKGSRGPLMRPADAPPVPKGKVRQLYPPPKFEAAQEQKNDASGRTLPEADLAGDEPFEARIDSFEPETDYEMESDPIEVDEDSEAPGSSLFISDAKELERRRQRARERAEARRRSEDEPASDSLPPEGDRVENRPVDDLPGSDEWPAY